MGAFRTRIRSVRFKSGGEVRVLPSVREETSRDVLAFLHRELDALAETHEGKIAGFALAVWTADGDAGASVRNANTSPHPPSVLPALTADLIRRVLVKDQVDRALGYDDETLA